MSTNYMSNKNFLPKNYICDKNLPCSKTTCPKKNFPWPKISCPIKIFPQPKITCPNKFFHNKKLHVRQKFSLIKNLILNKIFHVQNFMSSTQNTNPYPKNLPWSWNKAYIFQQSFCIHQKWSCSTKPTQQISITSMPPKFKSKFIQQYHMIYIAKIHDPSTLFKLHHAKKLNNSKCSQSQDYNMINHAMSKISIKANHNKMTMSQHQTCNKAWNWQISQQQKKTKTKKTSSP